MKKLGKDKFAFQYGDDGAHLSKKMRKKLRAWEEAKLARETDTHFDRPTQYTRFHTAIDDIFDDHIRYEFPKVAERQAYYQTMGINDMDTRPGSNLKLKESKSRANESSLEEQYYVTVKAVDFFYDQFIVLIDSINEMRRKFCIFKIMDIDNSKLLDTKDWVTGFQKYFYYVNLKWRIEQDGGGFNKSSRPIKLTKRDLQNKIFSDISMEDAFELIDIYCCLDFSPFGDIAEQNRWDLRCTSKFIRGVSAFKDSKYQQKVLCFYILLAARGVLLIKDFKKLYWYLDDNTQLEQLVPGQDYYLSCSAIEALSKSTLIESTIFTERVPKTAEHVHPQTQKPFLVKVKDYQYLLLTDLRQFRTGKKKGFTQDMQSVPASECQQVAIDFLNNEQKLSPTLFHNIFEKKQTDYQLSREYRQRLYACIYNSSFQFHALLKTTSAILPLKPKGDNAKLWHKIEKHAAEHYDFDPETRQWIINPDDPKFQDVYQSKDALYVRDKVATLPTLIAKPDVEKIQFRADIEVTRMMEKEIVADQMGVILDILPTFNMTLNKQQRALICSTTDLLCLGRSGTGKTTSSIIRMFTQEILYRSLLKQEQLNRQMIEGASRKRVKMTATDLRMDSGLRYIFVTASPVLTNEVKRFYSNIKEALINHLEAQELNAEAIREQRKAEKEKKLAELKAKGEDINLEALNEDSDPDEFSIEKSLDTSHLTDFSENKPKSLITAEDIEKKELLEFIELQEKELEEQRQVDQQIAIPAAFEDLQPRHFPLFTTIQKLIYMLDASLPYSFFSRDKNKNIIGMDSFLGWHSECGGGSDGTKGAMMINSHFKTNVDYDAQINKFGEQILDLEDQQPTATNEGDIYAEDDPEQQERDERVRQERQHQLAQHIEENQKKNRGNNAKENKAEMRLTFEVTFEVFESKFYSRLATQRQYKKLSASTVWTEIYSVIKGGLKAAKSYFGYVFLQDYLLTEGSSFLTGGEKRLIYYTFLSYEKWKEKVGAFDFMDVIHHVWSNRWSGMVYSRSNSSYGRLQFDYLLVDEVQDVPPKAIMLLLQLTREKVFFAGDTAQTIAKGVGAKFGDLQDIFTSNSINIPQVIQLNTNYRSHEQILNMANSVVDLIQLFFPRSIDRLIKEGAERQGLLPIILNPVDDKQLTKFFMGTKLSGEQAASDAQTEASSTNAQTGAAQFGCSQVVIVRNQLAKSRLPKIFDNMLCLTVYESKGLEFNDVIVYNFFQDSEASQTQWKLLNDVIYNTVMVPQLDDEILEMDLLDNENFEEFQRRIKAMENQTEEECVQYEEKTTLEIKADGYFQKKSKQSNIYKQFSLLCIELKYLYVAITRAKNRVIIYDDYDTRREPMQAHWTKLGLVHTVTKAQLQDPSLMPAVIRDFYEIGMSDNKSTPEQWKIQGIKLFRKKYYDQAIKCFTFSGDFPLVKRCSAHQKAEGADQLMSEANSLQWKIRNFTYLPKHTKKQHAKDAKNLRKQAREEFTEAGELFAECGLFSHAGSCFYTANNQLRAAEMFKKLKQFAQAGECYFKQGMFGEAAKMFEEGKMMPRAIECYEITQSWEQLLNSLSRCKDQFKDEEREALVNKYVPIALNSLYKMLVSANQGAEEPTLNKAEIQEMKIKMKYQKNVSQIMEEDEYGEEIESSDEEPEKEDGAEEGEEQQEAPTSEKDEADGDEEAKEDDQSSKKSFEVVSEEEEDEGADLLEQVFALKKKKAERKAKEAAEAAEAEGSDKPAASDQAGSENSFIIQSDDGAQQDDNQKTFDEFEHLSQFDPEDEFLQSDRSFSIIDSIVNSSAGGNLLESMGGESRMNSARSSTSEFSIVEPSEISRSGFKSLMESIMTGSGGSMYSYNQIELIPSQFTKDTYAEDVITQKIIFYISLFSDEVKDSIGKLKSKGLIHQQKRQGDAEDIDEFLIKLDDVDPEFINLILDILDYYELFKLSMMLCNRYKLTDRIGRYILHISQKYTNINLFRYDLEKAKVNSPASINWLSKQRGSSLLAHEAMHNVFGLIEPKFLTLKQPGQVLTKANSLGMQTYRTLLTLGYWKKLVYLTKAEISLDLCFKFICREHYQIIMKHLVEKGSLTNQGKYERMERQLFVKDYYLCRNTLSNEERCALMIEKSKDEHINYLNENFYGEQEDSYSDLRANIRKLRDFREMLLRGNDLPLRDFQKLTRTAGAEMEEQILSQALPSRTMKDRLMSDDFHQKQLEYMLVFEIATLRKHEWKNLEKAQYFSQNSVTSMFDIIIQAIRQLTNSHSSRQRPDEELNTALYSAFLLSEIKEELFPDDLTTGQNLSETGKDEFSSEDHQGLFIDFQDRFMIMNVNSPLANELIVMQQNIVNSRSNEHFAHIYKSKRKHFFKESSFLRFLAQKMKGHNKGQQENIGSLFTSSESTPLWNEIISDESGNAVKLQSFFIDMDCQFLMVPKQLVDQVLTFRLLSVLRKLMTLVSPYVKHQSSNAEEVKLEEEEATPVSWLTKDSMAVFFQKYQMFNEVFSFCSKHVFSSMREIYHQIQRTEEQFVRNDEFFKYWRRVNKHIFKEMSLVQGLNINIDTIANYYCGKDRLYLQATPGPAADLMKYGFTSGFSQKYLLAAFDLFKSMDVFEEQVRTRSEDWDEEDLLRSYADRLMRTFQVFSLSSSSTQEFNPSIIFYKYLLQSEAPSKKTKNSFKMHQGQILKGMEQLFTIQHEMASGDLFSAHGLYLDMCNKLHGYLNIDLKYKFIELGAFSLLATIAHKAGRGIFGTENLVLFFDSFQRDSVTEFAGAYLRKRKQDLQQSAAKVGPDEDYLAFEYYEEADYTPPEKLVKKQSSMKDEGYEIYKFEISKEIAATLRVTSIDDEDATALEVLAATLRDYLQELNKHEMVNLYRHIYANAYNLLMMLIVNVDYRGLKRKGIAVKSLFDTFNSVLDQFSNCPYDNHYESMYLLENGFLDESAFLEVYDEFHATEDGFKVTFFDFTSDRRDRSQGLICTQVVFPKSKTFAPSEIKDSLISKKKEIQALQTKEAMAGMRFHLLSHGVLKHYKANLKDQIQMQVRIRGIDAERKSLLQHFCIVDILKLSNEEIKSKLLESLDSLLLRKHLLIEMIATKAAKNSIDVNYIHNQSMDVQAQIDKLAHWIKNVFLPKKGEILAEYEDVHLTESMATPSKPINKINDKELQDMIEGISNFMLKLDTNMGIWQFKRNSEEQMNLEVMENRQRKIMLKWKSYSEQSRRQRVKILKEKKKSLA